MYFVGWLTILIGIQTISCQAEKPMEEITLIKTLLSEIFRRAILHTLFIWTWSVAKKKIHFGHS
jgi:hypothetical protein